MGSEKIVLLFHFKADLTAIILGVESGTVTFPTPVNKESEQRMISPIT